jgi:peptide/nickel transport system substrate-binding protein
MGEHQFNLVNYKNNRVDQLLAAGLRTLDIKKRQKIYRELHKILHEDQPCTFLTIPRQLSAIHKRFKGYTMSMAGLTHPEKWYVPANQQKYNP